MMDGNTSSALRLWCVVPIAMSLCALFRQEGRAVAFCVAMRALSDSCANSFFGEVLLRSPTEHSGLDSSDGSQYCGPWLVPLIDKFPVLSIGIFKKRNLP